MIFIFNILELEYINRSRSVTRSIKVYRIETCSQFGADKLKFQAEIN